MTTNFSSAEDLVQVMVEGRVKHAAIWLQVQDLHPSAVSRIGAALANNTSLKMLMLNECGIDADGALLGGRSFELCTSFHCLHWPPRDQQVPVLRGIHAARLAEAACRARRPGVVGCVRVSPGGEHLKDG